MPLLKTDDEARHVPSVWLGDPNLIRWPFDASFGQWILGFALTIPTFTLLGLVVPVIVWGGVFAWLFGKFLTRRFPEDSPKLIASPWTWRIIVMVMMVLIIPSPLKLVLPVNIFAALALTPIIAFLLVRKFSKHITPMTPFLYWIGVLWKILRRPRTPQVSTQQFSIVDNSVVSDDDESWDVGDLDLPLTITKD